MLKVSKDDKIAVVTLLVIGGIVGLIVYLTSGPNYTTLKKGLKEQSNIDVKTIEMVEDVNGIQIGTVTTEQGEVHPILVRVQDTGANSTETAWLIGKPKDAAEKDVRNLALKLGYQIESLSLTRNPRGVCYIGEIIAKSGEVLDVGETLTTTKNQPLSSFQQVVLKPSSYEQWIKNTLKKELNEEIEFVSELKPKDTSWEAEEAEQNRILEIARKKKLNDDINKGGLIPNIADIANVGNPIRIDPNLLLPGNMNNQPTVTYKSANAITKSKRKFDLELTLKTSPNPTAGLNISLMWKELPK